MNDPKRFQTYVGLQPNGKYWSARIAYQAKQIFGDVARTEAEALKKLKKALEEFEADERYKHE